MNKKVLKTMIALVVVFLVAMYVLKMFFPEEFVMAIENEVLINIGKYVDNNAWAYYLFGVITSFVTYCLYCSAICKKWVLKWYEYLIILVTIAINITLNKYAPDFYYHFNICSMIILPYIFGGKLKEVCVVYGIHGLSQILSLGIRNLPLYMKNINTLTLYAVGFESYLWLFLFYLFFNYKKEER